MSLPDTRGWRTKLPVHDADTTVVACRDCAAIQVMPPPPRRGRLKCWQCDRVLETTVGRSLDGALACAMATLLLLFPANLMIVMTVRFGPIRQSTFLASGLFTAWHQGWPLLTIVLGLQGIVLPFLYFGMLTASLLALRFGRRDRWIAIVVRWCETLDMWAMADVLLLGGGIGYGRIVSQIPVDINPGGWCFVGAAVMTMITRSTLDRRAVWRRLEVPPHRAMHNAIACPACDLVLPPDAEGHACPRCAATVHRRHPNSVTYCWALVAACWLLMPIAYGFPMSELWKIGTPEPHTIIDGIKMLFEHNFWYFGVIIAIVSVGTPFLKLIGLTWMLVSIRRGSRWRLREKTKLYRFIDDVGRWSNLDPFTVMIFAPMGQFGQTVHINIMGGSPAFLATVVLSMIATRMFDPRLMWDASEHTVGQAFVSPAHAAR